MKLSSARITHFRSIDDTEKFKIGDVTCLVGKNEAGKTAILQALEILNSSAGNDEYNKQRDYPRRYLNEYDQRHKDGNARVAITDWTLDEDDIEAIKIEFGPNCMPSTKITVSKSYDQPSRTWTTDFDEEAAIRHLIAEANFDATEKGVVAKCKTANDLLRILDGRDSNTEKHNVLLEKIREYRNNSPRLRVVDTLCARLPRFLYFSHYDRMSGKISVNQLEQDTNDNNVDEGDSVFLDFLDFAGTNLEELKSFQESEDLIAKVEAASNTITDKILEYWSQNESLSVNFSLREGMSDDRPPFNAGTIMEARVRNAIHRMSVPFSERSAGFIWFFSFLVKFEKVSKENDNIIILLDEPGLTLHAKAQKDLLRYFMEKLKPSHQVIYSTHSPFMVPSDDLMAVRTVEDVVKRKGLYHYDSKGTKVGDDILSTDKDTLFPLQGALGYEISQTLFVGKHTLLVEGPSDVLYLQAASAALKQTGRTGLDSSWIICPTGGVDKVSSFVSLFRGNSLHVAVLSDFAKGQKRKVDRLRESKLLETDHIYTIADFCDQNEADIEDLFSPGLFVSIVNDTYSLEGKHKLTIEKLKKANESTERMVLQTEDYFRLLPDDIDMFDHFTPSSFLIQHPDILSNDNADVSETLKRFERIFKTFNNLLPTP